MNIKHTTLCKINSFFKSHRYGMTLFAFLFAAILTGIGCVYFMRAFEFVLHHRLDFSRIGFWCFLTTPILFVIAILLIRYFAPCLSIGAALGASIGEWLGLATASCALIRMAAFLSGTIQAPMTAFVIIFEMTGHHQMLVPIMLASLIAFITARLLRAKHLYQTLSLNYEALLKEKDVAN